MRPARRREAAERRLHGVGVADVHDQRLDGPLGAFGHGLVEPLAVDVHRDDVRALVGEAPAELLAHALRRAGDDRPSCPRSVSLSSSPLAGVVVVHLPPRRAGEPEGLVAADLAQQLDVVAEVLERHVDGDEVVGAGEVGARLGQGGTLPMTSRRSDSLSFISSRLSSPPARMISLPYLRRSARGSVPAAISSGQNRLIPASSQIGTSSSTLPSQSRYTTSMPASRMTSLSRS